MRSAFPYEYRPYYTFRYLIPEVATLSPRKMLFYNNILLFICSIGLMGFSIYLCVTFSNVTSTDSTPSPSTGRAPPGTDHQTEGAWLNWLFLVIQGFLLAVISIIGMRGGHLVDVSLLLAYFWLLAVFVAPVVLSTVACFDFYQYLQVWFRHNWDSDSFGGIRELFCEDGTADTLCRAPVLGGPYGSADQWCIHNYNSTACTSIQSHAIKDALALSRTFTFIQGITGILNMLEIGISMYLCTRILTHSVITESMNDIINFLLILPITGCIGIGSYLWRLTNISNYFSWFSYYFFAMAAVQIVALPIGIIAGRLKSRPMLLFYIALATIVTAGLGAAGVTAFIFSGIVTNTLEPSRDEKNNLVCAQNFIGCCCCNAYLNNTQTSDLCPEWTTREVVSLLQLDLKLTGVVALVSMAYLVGSLAVAGLLSTDLKNYKTDYV